MPEPVAPPTAVKLQSMAANDPKRPSQSLNLRLSVLINQLSWKERIELLGVLAIVASLVFVGLELRQNRYLAEAAAYQARTDSEIAFQSLYVDPQRVAEAAVKYEIGEPTTAADDAYLLSTNWVRYVNYENIHYQLERGLLDEDFWHAIIDGLYVELQWAPQRDWWRERRTSFRPAFAVEIDRIVAEAEENASDP